MRINLDAGLLHGWLAVLYFTTGAVAWAIVGLLIIVATIAVEVWNAA